jgi:hypothetical protein
VILIAFLSPFGLRIVVGMFRILVRLRNSLSCDFYCFPQSLLIKVGILPRLGNDRFLINSFQFIHYLNIIRYLCIKHGKQKNCELRLFVFRLGLTPNSNVWVGAWWIGFLLSAVMCTILAMPVLAFPSALPGKFTVCLAHLKVPKYWQLQFSVLLFRAPSKHQTRLQ